MELKAGYKKSRFGLVPVDWQIVELGSVINSCSSGATPYRGRTDFYKGEVRWITSGELNYNVIHDTNEHISQEAVIKTNLTVHPAGTFLFAITGLEAAGTRGSCGIAGAPATTNQSCMAIYPSADLDTNYLFHYYRYRGNELAFRYCQGTKQQSYTAGLVKKLPIELPPTIVEQRAIAAALSDVDALLESLDRLIAKKRDIKQAAMQQLLTGKTRLPEFEGEWEVKRLGEIARIQRGASPRPIDSPIWFDQNSSIGWVRISDITRSGMYLNETTQYLSSLGIQQSRPVPRGSLIMSICATVGRPIITNIDTCIHDGFVAFDNLEADQSFIYYMLKWIEPDWTKHGQTGSQMNLNTVLINRTGINLPPCDEQAAIAAVLSDMDVEIATLEQRRNKTIDIKQAMMQELLTGRIRLVKLSEPTAQTDSEENTVKKHNWAFNEAVVIATLTKHFGKENYPLGRKRYTKLSYLLHRHYEGEAEGYMKKAAGPYNPKTKYGGPEKIALKSGYIREHTHGRFMGFVVADNIGQAEEYFEKWYGSAAVQWLEQFRYMKNEDLELLATVDMAVKDLRASGKKVDVASVKELIHTNSEWKAKLDRAAFSDTNIANAINESQRLFNCDAVGGIDD